MQLDVELEKTKERVVDMASAVIAPVPIKRCLDKLATGTKTALLQWNEDQTKENQY